MTEYVWERIDGFRSNAEFTKFVRWIEKQVNENTCEELLVAGNTPSDWQERRFKSKDTGEVWRLVHPDPGYFPGAWGPLE